nr:anthocyanidin 3-O-glucosyltransferase 5-like [Tanacetum cinerariifolium]
MDTDAPKPHVAFLASLGMGHITPLFELALHLVTEHNIQVTFLVITTESTHAQNSYLKSSNSHPDLHVVDLPPADMSSLISDDMDIVIRISFLVEESVGPLRTMLSELNVSKLKALIIDIFCTSMFDVCKDLSIPVYSFFTASAVLFMLSMYLPVMDREVEVRNRKVEEYKWYLLHVSRLSMATGIFLNTWDDLEPVSLKALKHEPFLLNNSTPPVYPIGPLTKQNESVVTEYDKEIIAWLDKQPKDSVLFVALGSGGTLTSEQLTELAWGLELSQQRFILVVRNPDDDAASSFFSTRNESDDPKAYLPKGFVDRTNRVGLVASSWAQQVAVLNHPSTGAFLSHCGWNSTVESLKHGVPIIGWPMYPKQRMNATMLSNEVGVAVKMPVVGDKGETVVVGREEIERVVRMVMEGEEGKTIRSKAKELEVSGRAALSCGGMSYETLTRLTESWKHDG